MYRYLFVSVWVKLFTRRATNHPYPIVLDTQAKIENQKNKNFLASVLRERLVTTVEFDATRGPARNVPDEFCRLTDIKVDDHGDIGQAIR